MHSEFRIQNSEWWLRRTAGAVLGLCLVGLTGCGPDVKEAPLEVAAGPRVEEMAHGVVDVTFTVDPSTIEYERDTLLTIRLSTPDQVRIGLPPLADRLEGFILNGTFEDAPVTEGQRTTRRLHARLTPLPGREHRIAPMAIVVSDGRQNPPDETWFPTHPIVLTVTPPMIDDAGTELHDALQPVWIRPTFRSVAGTVVLVLAGLGLIWLLWKLAGRVHRQVKLMRMSPKERALKELAILLGKDLISQHKVKDFYLQLTMIVRRYIERAHKVRAPEQTTEEFLAAVSHDTQFSPEVVARLREFLQAADLVKFAAYEPNGSDIERSTTTARSYIEQDAAEGEEGEQR
ncbi:MAG: hypothetical protein HQ523_08730 [Lentisphaerae bacterium]|nr:hypothetical protein [Lentisphaerota bacterium]